MRLTDKYGRLHNYLRMSLTSSCNLNCIYCNPVNSDRIPKQFKQLSNEEIIKLIDIFVNELEFTKVRLTGGEPFARKDVINLFREINKIKQKKDFELNITTNGTLVGRHLMELKDLGVDRINFSLDSLNENTFKDITGKNKLSETLDAIYKYESLGFPLVKINTVIIKGINNTEILDFVEFVKDTGRNIRFIEYMPFPGNDWSETRYINSEEIKNIIESKYKLVPVNNLNQVAKNYNISGFSGKISFISSMSDHFCSDCNRLRITSDGNLKLCLFSENKTDLDLKELLSSNYKTEEIAGIIQSFLLDKEYKHPEISSLIHISNNNMIGIGG